MILESWDKKKNNLASMAENKRKNKTLADPSSAFFGTAIKFRIYFQQNKILRRLGMNGE